MDWTSIDNQSDLDTFDASNCWEDSEVLEYYALVPNEAYFPEDVSRSGWTNKNIHILVQSDSSEGTHIEIVLIDCDHFDSAFIDSIHFSGRIDGLKRVEVYSGSGDLRMRCSRVIYRWLSEELPFGKGYFRQSDSIS
jgi:hypothetical protein